MGWIGLRARTDVIGFCWALIRRAHYTQLVATVLIVAGVIVSRIGGLHTTCFRRFDAYNCYVPKKWHYQGNRYVFTYVAAAISRPLASGVWRRKKLVTTCCAKADRFAFSP
jgi:hypothetical protein